MAADQFQAVVSDLELAAAIHRVNKLYDRFSQSPDYKEAGVLRDTDFDARRLFQMYDPSGNVVEIYAYLRNVREEILMH